MSVMREHEATPQQVAPPNTQHGPGRWRAAARAGTIAFCGLLAVGLILFGIGFVQFTREIVTSEARAIGKADGIVVLTGGSQRVSDGLSLLADGHGKRLLISGVYQRTGRDEIARQSGEQRALLDCCVDLGKSARNTIGNAIEARRWVAANRFASLLVVTSNYHMARTLAEFRHVMGHVELIPYPVVSDSIDIRQVWSDPAAFRLALLEYAKVVVARARHLVEHDPEHSRLPVLIGRQKPVGPWLIEGAAAP